MPRVDLTLWDRVYILKLICTAQMTSASFLLILYFYLLALQYWISIEDDRRLVNEYKWSVMVLCIIDFCLGTLLAIGANMQGIRRRRRIISWIVLETVFIPVAVFCILKMYFLIRNSKISIVTDIHIKRISIVHTCFLLFHYFFITYTIDYLSHRKPKVVTYDPSIRPESVHEPTDPKITTTESRHIRMCQSFLFQPSTSKKSQEDAEVTESEQPSTSSQS